MKEIYVDANIFVAVICNEPGSAKCKKLLEEIQSGQLCAYSSVLAVDEVMWAVQRQLGRQDAIDAAEFLFSLDNLTLVDATPNILRTAVTAYSEMDLAPRDCIHLATMQSRRLLAIATLDADFDKVPGIKRLDLER